LKTVFQSFLNELKDDISRSKTSNKSIKSRMNVIMKCKPLMKSKIDEISYEHLKKFLIWRNEESNKLGKQLSGKTLRGRFSYYIELFELEC